MVKQYTGNQYDDDLTIGTEDYDDSYYTGSVDLFEFATDEESPISRLKSLILSIDWEITDEILLQFNEELLDLRDIWAGEKINLVYVQALEKISKYIYQKKANSHPSAIKLLLTLYHNLEKIVSSYDLSEEQKKEILLEDVKRFESLKRHIGQSSRVVDEESPFAQLTQQQNPAPGSSEQDLLTLKALVLGIDWEITDRDLGALRSEVVRLEEKFADSRPKLILLQGIGTLAAYIKLKQGNTHADAFKLLHLFYESLEKIVIKSTNREEEKAILFPAVERFNTFKALLGSTIAADAISRDETESEDEDSSGDAVTLAPAFADIPEEEVQGFQAEEEAQTLGLESSGNIDNHVENFFIGTSLADKQELDSSQSTTAANEAIRQDALRGADVEVDDEEDTDAVLFGAADLAPALSNVSEEEINHASSPAPAALSTPAEESPVRKENSDGLTAELNADVDSSQKSGMDFSTLDRELVLQGVDVETEADDDSDEEALPLMGGKLAPALAANDEVSIYNSASDENIEEEIAGTLGGFFDEEIAAHLTPAAPAEEQTEPAGVVHGDTQEDDQIDTFFALDEDTATPQEDVLQTDREIRPVDLPSAEKQIAPALVSDVEEEVVFALVEEEPVAVAPNEGLYQSLQSCVDALAIELDEKILAGLWREINSLDQHLTGHPLEKTFLQLLTSVTRHIDRHRTDASVDAYGLCRSITSALIGLQGDDLSHNQEMLLNQTQKVLEWQEQLLHSQ